MRQYQKALIVFVVFGVLLLGVLLEVRRTLGYSALGLKIGLGLGIASFLLFLFGQILGNEAVYQKQVWRDRSTGRILKETDWTLRGFPSLLFDRGEFAGCFILSFIVVPVVGLTISAVISSFANISNLTLGSPPRYSAPYDHYLPTASPDEADRVWDRRGFSLCFPKGWKVEPSSTGLYARPAEGAYASLEVDLLSSAPDKAGASVAFQGEEGHQQIYPGSGFLGGQFHHELWFKRNGVWFRLRFRLDNFKDGRGPFHIEPIPIVEEYFDTFRKR